MRETGDFVELEEPFDTKGGGGSMTNSKDLLREFVKSVNGKDYSEVIILADREATLAYRNALRSGDDLHHNSSGWCLYSKTLSNMIGFLRNEVKLKQPDSDTNSLFHSLQNGIDQQNLKFIRHYKVKQESL
jgi:hypothetical protein